MKSIESGNNVNVSASYTGGGLNKSLASTLIENKDRIKQLRDEDERERTIDREKRERQSITIDSYYGSQIPKEKHELLSIDATAEKCKV